MKSNFYKKTKKKGAVYMFIVFIMTVTTVAIAVGFSTPNIREYKNAQRDTLSNNAFLFSEAGNEDVFYRLKNEMNVPAEIVMSLGSSEGTTTATTTVTVIDANTKEVVSDSEIKDHTRKSKLRISDIKTEAEFLYGAQIGSWGVSLSNNAEIKGVLPAVGDIYSSGPLLGGGVGNIITGNAYSATNIIPDNSASSTSCVSDQIVGKTNPEIDFAQSFVASTTADAMHSVEIYLKKTGNPSSKTVRIVADNAGEPDTTTITSGTLDRNKVSSVYSWVSITFDTAVTLTGGNTYWIILDAQRNNANNWTWCIDTSGPYSGGSVMYSEDWGTDPWTPIAGDLTFKTYYGEGNSLIEGLTVSGDAHADTINNSTITSDAYYQSISGSSVGGSSYPGSPTPSVISLPISESSIDGWVSVATAGGTISGSCPGTAGCSDSMGPIEIDGDLTVDSDTFTVTGTIYVTGNFFTDNNSSVSCTPAYGATSCVIVADGYMDFRNNTSFSGSGDPDSFILLLTRKAGCLSTSGVGCGPNFSAIYHNNNAVNGGVFYAQDSIAHLENGASVSSVVSLGMVLDNNAAIIYDLDLQDVQISAGADGGWLVEDWREVE